MPSLAYAPMIGYGSMKSPIPRKATRADLYRPCLSEVESDSTRELTAPHTYSSVSHDQRHKCGVSIYHSSYPTGGKQADKVGRLVAFILSQNATMNL